VLDDRPGEPTGERPGFAELDLDRARRRGYPEAVLCAGKTPAQVAAIAAALRASGARTLFTRADAEHARAVLDELPDALHADDCGLLAWPAEPPEPVGGGVLVVAAGTSDYAVAREAQLTARHLGRRAELVMDVGVAGLHRILGKLDALRAAPVIAVPTSTGYGAAFGGLAALLGMLNSCAPGVAVVNIDNGYGAGHLAAQIAAPG
jgi:pyridinium-3,5-biscarboxylic acid mononucleotide synthase